MKTNLPNIGEHATDAMGVLWTIRDVKAGELHGVEGRETFDGKFRTSKRNYCAQLLLESVGGFTWQPLTAWRNLCQFGTFTRPATKQSRCKGYDVPAYQNAALALTRADGTFDPAEVARVTGINPRAIYIGPARVDGGLVDGEYRLAVEKEQAA